MRWLLETDPTRRPSIQQVLCHPAIASKVTELQMLFPSNQTSNAQSNNPHKQYISEKPQRYPASQPNLNYPPNRVYQSSIPSTGIQTPQIKKKNSILSRVETTTSRKDSKQNVSMSEIEKLKNKAYLSQKNEKANILPAESRGINMRGNPANSRGNIASPVPQKKNVYNIGNAVGFGEVKQRNFIKKADRKYTNRVIVEGRQRTITDKSQKTQNDIDKSINDRKERINQLLSLYGKPKDGAKCNFFILSFDS